MGKLRAMQMGIGSKDAEYISVFYFKVIFVISFTSKLLKLNARSTLYI